MVDNNFFQLSVQSARSGAASHVLLTLFTDSKTTGIKPNPRDEMPERPRIVVQKADRAIH